MLDRNSVYFAYLETLRLYHQRTQTLLDGIGIYPGQPPLLFLLDKKGGRSQREISEILRTSPATVAVMIKRLEKLELVKRERDMEDQRILRVYLTEKGRSKSKEAKLIIDNISSECFGNFTKQEEYELKRLLGKMKTNLEKINKVQEE